MTERGHFFFAARYRRIASRFRHFEQVPQSQVAGRPPLFTVRKFARRRPASAMISSSDTFDKSRTSQRLPQI
jgi:hypothetical protein